MVFCYSYPKKLIYLLKTNFSSCFGNRSYCIRQKIWIYDQARQWSLHLITAKVICLGPSFIQCLSARHFLLKEVRCLSNSALKIVVLEFLVTISVDARIHLRGYSRHLVRSKGEKQWERTPELPFDSVMIFKFVNIPPNVF